MIAWLSVVILLALAVSSVALLIALVRAIRVTPEAAR